MVIVTHKQIQGKPLTVAGRGLLRAMDNISRLEKKMHLSCVNNDREYLFKKCILCILVKMEVQVIK